MYVEKIGKKVETWSLDHYIHPNQHALTPVLEAWWRIKEEDEALELYNQTNREVNLEAWLLCLKPTPEEGVPRVSLHGQGPPPPWLLPREGCRPSVAGRGPQARLMEGGCGDLKGENGRES